jgi:hypothetical protein
MTGDYGHGMFGCTGNHMIIAVANATRGDFDEYFSCTWFV